MMEGHIVPVTATLASVGVAAAVVAARRSQEAPSPARFAAVTALIFAAQMFNFPIHDGTSGHLIGGVLASLLLGIPFGVLSMTVVVVIQSLVFADGGISILGANVLNMAVIAAGAGGWFAQILRRGTHKWRNAAAIGAASWLSVMLAATACSAELAIAGTISFTQVLPAMLGVHAVIGLGEAAITLGLLALVPEAGQRATDTRRILVPFAAALTLACVLFQFASANPDGLEAVAIRKEFVRPDALVHFAPLPDYAVPGIAHETAATGLAGLAGVAAVSLAAFAVSRAWRRRELHPA